MSDVAIREPDLREVIAWFENEMVPRRTAAAGFSGNRLWKTPAMWLRGGNTEDPNGLCGDASWYLHEQFWEAFNGYTTRDGFEIGMVLWEGAVLNHIACVMRLKAKTSRQTYTYDTRTRLAVSKGSTGEYGTSELMRLVVLDLYYKKHGDLRSWWSDMDAMGGTVTLSTLSDM